MYAQLHLASIVIATTSLVIVTSDDAEVKNTTIELAQILFRHGDRTPISTYPADKYQEEQWQPYGWGNLTDIGASQAFNLGRYLRDHYIQLGLRNLTADQVSVRCTYIQRTRMTADCVMAGLTFPDNVTTFDPRKDTQPFTVHNLPQEEDQLFSMKSCPVIEMLKNRWMASSTVWKEYKEKNKDLFKELSAHSGYEVNDDTISTITDAVYCETKHNLTQPPWMEKFVPQLLQLYDKSTEYYSPTKEIQRLQAGPLLENMIKNIYAKIHDKADQKKLFLYSAHDSNVAAFLKALDVFNNRHPPYVGCVMVELHRKEETYFVKILFKNDTTKDPFPLKMPGCEELCPLAKFLTLVKNVTLREEDRSSECGPVWGSMKPGENIIPLTIAGVLVLIVVIAGVAYILKRRRLRSTKAVNYRQLLHDSEPNLLNSDDDDDELL